MERRFSIILIIAAALLVFSLAAIAFLLVRGGQGMPFSLSTPDRCSEENIRSDAEAIGALVHHFEDVKFVAILTNREQLVHPIMKMQDLRYEAEALELPDCLAPLEKSAIDYMNSVIIYLSHHMAGIDEAQVKIEFLYSEDLLKVYKDEYVRITGKTFIVPVPEVTPGG